MARPYADYIRVNKDFVPVFDANMDRKYPSHWLSFYPHDTFKVILGELIGSLEGDSSEKRKSLWMSGAYGTGKSFASFTLKHIIEDDLAVVKNYFDKHNISTALFNRLQNVKSQGDIIVVTRSSSGGIVGNNQLFTAVAESIKSALRINGYEYTGGRTLYDKILGILKDSNSSFNFKGAFAKNKNRFTAYASSEDIVKELEYLGATDSLELLQTIVEVADADGFNFAQSETEIVSWIRDVITTNNVKIVFIWDEFSGYFQNNQHSIDGLQELSHASFDMPFYFLLITHRRHDQFIYESDRRMVLEARFKMNRIDMVPTTAFMLMRNVIEIEKDLREEWQNTRANLWGNVEKMVQRSLGIYAQDIKDEDLKGLLPLHPFAAFMLQNISREMNSNQRTMFQFLCGDPNASENTRCNFRWFIENSDVTKWGYLTCDYIWDYFFHYNNNELDEDAVSALNHYNTFQKQCANEDEIRVLKVVLLLKAMKGEKGRGIGNLLRPTLHNISFAFAGTDVADKVRSIMDGFVKKSVFGSIEEGGQDVLYITQSQSINDEKYKEKEAWARAAFSFEKIISNPEYDLLNAFSLKGYYPLRFESICATHKDLKIKTVSLKALDINKIPLIFMFAKTDEDKVKNRESINNMLAELGMDIIIVDLSSQPLSSGENNEYERFIKSAALHAYFEKVDGGQAALKLKEAKDIISTWKKRLYESPITLYTRDNAPVLIGGSNQYASRITELNDQIFTACLETVITNENVFKTQFSADVAIMGMQKKAIPSAYNYLSIWKDKLAKENIWNNPEYASTMPSHAVAKMKQAVDAYIIDSIKTSGSVGIAGIWNLLRGKPFGLLPCTGSMFILGFLMKEYADCGYYKKDTVKYPTPLTAVELADMLQAIVKGIKNADTLSIVRMTEKQEQFCKISGAIFKLPPQKQNAVQDVMIGIKERLPNDGFPLWALKYYVKNNDKYGLKDAILPVIDAYCRFVASQKDGAKNETQLAEEIVDLFGKDAGTKEYLCEVYNSSNLRLGMQAYIEEYRPELIRLAVEIADEGRYIEQVKSRLTVFASWLWEKGDADKQIDAVYLDYQLIGAINKIIPQPTKKIEDAASAIGQRISSIKMPLDFFKGHFSDLDKLLQSLVSIYRTRGFKEVSKTELVDEINTCGEQFVGFFMSQSKTFVTCLRSRINAEQLSDDDINKIYSKLESAAIDRPLDSFLESLIAACDEYKKAQKYNQLLSLWKSLSGGYDSPAKWSDVNETPILCLFADCIGKAKEVFDAINVGRPSINDSKIMDAINFLNTNENMSRLGDKSHCDKMLLQFVSGEYEMLFSDIAEVRRLLYSKLESKVYNWYLDKNSIDRIIKIYAEEKYKTPQFVGKVIEKIDELPIEKVKEYLKELIKKEPLVGIKIMKN